MQTVVAHQSEIWSLDVDPAGELMFSGSNDGEIKAWSIDNERLNQGLQETDTGEVRRIERVVESSLIVASS